MARRDILAGGRAKAAGLCFGNAWLLVCSRAGRVPFPPGLTLIELVEFADLRLAVCAALAYNRVAMSSRKAVFPHRVAEERAEWRVHIPGAGRVVLVFDTVEKAWSGHWEDSGQPLDLVEIRGAASLADLQLGDGRPPPRP